MNGNENETGLLRVNLDGLLDRLCELPDGVVLNFSLVEEGDINYGACFHDLYDKTVLSVGYWGEMDPIVLMTDQDNLKNSMDTRNSVRNALRNEFEAVAGKQEYIYIKPERYRMLSLVYPESKERPAMTNRESFSNDLDDILEDLAALSVHYPQGATKKARKAQGDFAAAIGRIRATIGCMRNDYIISEHCE